MVDGCLGCFHLSLIDNAVMNIHVQVCLWTHIFITLTYPLRSGISGLLLKPIIVALFFFFFPNCYIWLV